VQLLRTYPSRRPPYPFAPHGERSVARAYAKALRRARALVYLEDQFVWSKEVAAVFAAALDAQPGLVRRSAGDVDLWRVLAPSSRLSLLPSGLARHAVAGDRAPVLSDLRLTPPAPVPAGREGASADIPAGDPGRLLVLADARDGGWRARVDGHALPRRTAWGWAQAFEVPAAGGHLELSHAQAGRRTALLTELVAALAVLVLALPAGRRRTGLEDDVELEDDVKQAPRSRAAL
jgi:hypothetical protein